MKNLDLPRVGFAAFVGILVGSVVAINLGHYFWWVGVLIGIAMGIFALGPMRTIHALVQAGSIAHQELREVKVDMRKHCSVSIANLVPFFQFLVLPVLYFGLSTFFLWFLPTWSLSDIFLAAFLFWAVCSMWTIVFFLFIHELQICKSVKYTKFLDYSLGAVTSPVLFFFLMTYPFVFLFWGVPMFFYLTYLFISWIFAKAIPAMGKFSWKFAKMFFLYIHSEETVQISAYVAIGTVLGWYFKAPFSAAVIGGVVGELSYRFITLRFLHQKIST